MTKKKFFHFPNHSEGGGSWTICFGDPDEEYGIAGTANEEVDAVESCIRLNGILRGEEPASYYQLEQQFGTVATPKLTAYLLKIKEMCEANINRNPIAQNATIRATVALVNEALNIKP